MKIRSGFVSNSSSSSFVVAFPKDMELTQEAVKKYIFGEGVILDNPYSSDYMTTDRAAEIILRDIKDQGEDSRSSAIQIIGNTFENAPEFDYDFYWTLDPSKKDAYHKEFDKKLELFLKTVEGGLKGLEESHNLYLFEYSDNDDGEGVIMEHGGTFDKVKHWKQSNH